MADEGAEPSRRVMRLQRAASRRVASVRIVLEGLEDRGNRAAVLRTAESLGLLHVHEVAPSNPEQGRARGVAHGGEKWLHVHVHADPSECRLALAGFQCLAALPPVDELGPSPSWHSTGGKRRRRQESTCDDGEEARVNEIAEPPTDVPASATTASLASVALEDIDFSQPTALIFGNEKHGVSDAMLALCDGAFHIAQHGLTESLNVSVAAAIAMHYSRVARVAALRRRADGLINASGGDLSVDEVAALCADYSQRGRHHGKGSTQD